MPIKSRCGIVHVTGNFERDARLERLGSLLIILPSNSLTQCPQMPCKPFSLSNEGGPKPYCYRTRHTVRQGF